MNDYSLRLPGQRLDDLVWTEFMSAVARLNDQASDCPNRAPESIHW